MARTVKQVQSRMVLGLGGTGSTAASAVSEIAALLAAVKLEKIVGVPPSKRTFEQEQPLTRLASGARRPMLNDHLRIDLTIDGADEKITQLTGGKGVADLGGGGGGGGALSASRCGSHTSTASRKVSQSLTSTSSMGNESWRTNIETRHEDDDDVTGCLSANFFLPN